MNNKLYVCCMLQNALGWKSRLRNYHTFRRFIEQSDNAVLCTAEIAYGDHPHILPHSSYHLELRTDCEIWNKEGALNLLMQRLPPDAEYIAWFDADVTLTDPKWVINTIELLQHYDVVQLFSHTQDLGASHQPIGPILQSYYYRYVSEGHDLNKLNKNKEMITGLAWAARKSVLSKIGMLPDWCVFSSCDRHIAAGFIGNIENSFGHGIQGLTPSYLEKCRSWGIRANSIVKGNVSYLPGMLLHYWHGERKNRGYVDRWKIMRDFAFDPDEDIVKDWQGLYRLSDNKPGLRDAFRVTLRLRNEDDPGDKLLP